MRLTLGVALAAVFILLQSNLNRAQTNTSFAPTARIEESSFSGLIIDPHFMSFDLSPDGKTVALLIEAGSKVDAPLSLVTQDIGTKRVIASRELGNSTFATGDSFSQVFYSSSQKYLIVQDSQTIRVVDSKSLEPIRTISPPAGKEPQIPIFATGASNRDVFVCAFGPDRKFNTYFHTGPAQVEIIDISSGERLGEWPSEDLPQSISPNGELIAVSSPRAQQGVLPLNVFDVQGRKVAELTGGFSFKKVADPSKPLGRVMGLFVGNLELLLTPDQNFDESGHVSGDSLQLVSIPGKQAQQIIKPRQFASTGEMAVSADHRTIVALSWYIPPRYLAHPHWVLPPSSPEAMVFGRNTILQVEASFPIKGFGLRASGWMEHRRPQLSSDGSVLAIAQDTGITILRRNPHP